MSYFTERNGFRKPIEKTADISVEMYALLFDCCNKYNNNIAWAFPEECPDGWPNCGLDESKLSTTMTFEIPELYKDRNGVIAKPSNYYGNIDEYNQYALLDFIEFMAWYIKDYKSVDYHGFFRHDHLKSLETFNSREEFRTEINAIFDKTGLLYQLTSQGSVERKVEKTVLSPKIVQEIQQIKEQGLKDLLNEAIDLFKQPHPKARRDAVEKIWDALERLKTYYADLSKKQSAIKIVNDMANGETEFINLFNDEFNALTKIGNGFRIRHHETDKIEITDNKYYDYFFNRCLSLIALTLQYLK